MSQNRYKYTCPSCKNNNIEEVLINVTQYTTIDTIDKDGDFKYGKSLAEDGEVQNYQCSKCGYILKDENGKTIQDQSSLVEWLGRMNLKGDRDETCN